MYVCPYIKQLKLKYQPLIIRLAMILKAKVVGKTYLSRQSYYYFNKYLF